MISSIGLLGKRRFLPLFVTQFLGAFNDNLFKNAMVFFATYQIFNSVEDETRFSAIATGLFILPFFLFSALAGQLADSYDKAKIMRIIKLAEILIMLVGATGIMMGSIALMLTALVGMGIHSTFFGPIKYAIIPQHMAEDEVLGGTGLVEAGTYIAILGGTIAGGLIVDYRISAAAVILVAATGWFASRYIPPAPPVTKLKIDWNVFRSSYRLIAATMHIKRLYLAIISISVFWTIAAVLGVLFPPLVKNIFHAQKDVASVFLAIFSVGIAIGSVIINRLLKGHVSARYSPVSVLVMAVFVGDFYLAAHGWGGGPDDPLVKTLDFIAIPGAWRIFFDLAMIAITGGMFVVPLYAFLTTTVDKSQTSRTVAANNIVNSAFMVGGSVGILGATMVGVGVDDALLVVLGLCLLSAVAAWHLHRAGDVPRSGTPSEIP
ncbi:MAG: MFS transporter [Pseudomonadota bacterium]